MSKITICKKVASMPQMKRLTFDGTNDLYLHQLYGARTLEDIAYMDKVAAQPKKKLDFRYGYDYVECSTEMYLRHERCIEQNGFGMFGD